MLSFAGLCWPLGGLPFAFGETVVATPSTCCLARITVKIFKFCILHISQSMRGSDLVEAQSHSSYVFKGGPS